MTNHHHSLFYNGQFPISWIPLAAELLNSYLIESKNSIYIPRSIAKTRREVEKLLRDVIFPSSPSVSIIPCFTMANLQLDEYLLQRNFSNLTKLELKSFYYIRIAIRKSSSCCMSSFSNYCLANQTFLLLRWPVFIKMTIIGSQFS